MLQLITDQNGVGVWFRCGLIQGQDQCSCSLLATYWNCEL